MADIRQVQLADSRRIWEIRNQPSARQVSGTKDSFSFESHQAWFQDKYFSNKKYYCLVLTVENQVVGYCRFDIGETDNDYVISIALDAAFQGRGFGSTLLSDAIKLFSTLEKNKTITATVDISNKRSMKLFIKHQFKVFQRNKTSQYLRLDLGHGTFHKTVHGSKWILFGSITSKVLGLVSFLLLARLLDPTSYGLIAIALLIVGIFNEMLITGFETAVIQRQNDTDKYLDAVWTFNLIKALVVMLIVYLIGPAVAEFFHATQAVEVIRWSGLFILIPALGNIKQLYLFKNFQFDKLYYRDVFGQIFYIAVGALYAIFIAADVWALFYANLAKYIVSVLVVYYYIWELPKFFFQFKILKELISYGKWITAQNFVDYFLSIVDNALIGRLLGPSVLGLYSKGRNLAGTALSLVANMLKDLSFVAFSKVQNDKEKISRGFLMGLDMVLFIGVINIFVVWFGGQAIVQLVLGDQWLGIIPLLQIFTLFAVTNGVVALAYSLFDGSGKPQINFQLKLVSLILYTALSYVGIRYYGVIGATVGITLSNSIVMIYALIKLQALYEIKFSVILSNLFQVVVPIGITTMLLLPITQFYSFAPVMLLIVIASYLLIILAIFWWFGRRFSQGGSHTILLIIKSLRKI